MHFLFRRPALLIYSKYWFVFRIILTVIHSITSKFNGTGHCLYLAFRVVGFAFLQPILAYNAMIFDSNWWQSGQASQSLLGVSDYIFGDNALSTSEANSRHNVDFISETTGGVVEEDFDQSGSNNEKFRGALSSLHSFPKAGQDLHIQAAQTLAVVIDRIGVRENVTILNFAHLKFSTSVLGCGSFSKVYKGAFKGNLVAIKSIYTIDLTAEVIDKLATEAKILTAVQNPNVVIIYGKLCWLIDSLVM